MVFGFVGPRRRDRLGRRLIGQRAARGAGFDLRDDRRRKASDGRLKLGRGQADAVADLLHGGRTGSLFKHVEQAHRASPQE